MKNYKTYVPVHTDMFLDWFNNFLSLPCFAEHYGISTKKAKQIIRKGEALHESNFGSILEWR